MLTECGHGLDAKNLETTATLLRDGSFDLHTPHPEAAKAMPPSTPVVGEPKVALVFARLMVEGDDRGVRPFIVPINDGVSMAPGVVSQALPPRAGATPLDHAITSFHHVSLPSTALLGDLQRPPNHRQHFLDQIHRVTVGSMALTMIAIPSLRQACHIVARFSQQRTVEDAAERRRKPILEFQTQLRPIVAGLAQAAVYDAYAEWSVREFQTRKPHERYVIATLFKAVVSDGTLATLIELTCRLGWRGQFRENKIIDLSMFHLANTVAEGDTTALCVRLANEILLDKHQLPPIRMPERPLAVREDRLFSSLRSVTRNIYAEHEGPGRPSAYNASVLLWSKDLITSIGQRMAIEAALETGRTAPPLIAMYESDCLLRSRNIVAADQLTRAASDEVHVVSQLKSKLHQLVEADNAYVDVPILSQQKWAEFGATLRRFGARSDLRHHEECLSMALRACL